MPTNTFDGLAHFLLSVDTFELSYYHWKFQAFQRRKIEHKLVEANDNNEDVQYIYVDGEDNYKEVEDEPSNKDGEENGFPQGWREGWLSGGKKT